MLGTVVLVRANVNIMTVGLIAGVVGSCGGAGLILEKKLNTEQTPTLMPCDPHSFISACASDTLRVFTTVFDSV